MDSNSLYEQQLQQIKTFCKNEPSEFFYKKIIGAETISEAINQVKEWKDSTKQGDDNPKTVMEAATMFALYRDLSMRHASRKMLWDKGLDQKMFNFVMVQSKNNALGED
jgi:hypothetical protein